MSESAADIMTGAETTATRAERDAEFVRALEDHQPRIRRLASRFGLYGAEAEDAVQEIVTLAWAGRAGFRGESMASTWLTRIAVNYLTSHRRKILRRWRLWTERRYEHEPQNGESALDFDLHEQYRAALAAVHALPVRLRRVFVLRYLEELPVDDVAEILGIPSGTVRSRGYHARLKLREALKDLAR